MDQLRREILAAIMKINQYCDFVILGSYDHADAYIPFLIDEFRLIIPQIIMAYDEIDILKGKNISIWTEMLKRSMEALSSDDDFIKQDILRTEMIECLNAFVECLETNYEF